MLWLRCSPLKRALCLIHKKSVVCGCRFLWHFVHVLSAIQYCFSLPNEVAMYLVLKNRSDCLIVLLSLREVSIVGSSRFEQFGAFTYRLKVCRQLSIVLRCLMKRQSVCRCKFQCHCLIELSCPCVVSWFVGEGLHIDLVAK